jgi:hypothetical protein
VIWQEKNNCIYRYEDLIYFNEIISFEVIWKMYFYILLHLQTHISENKEEVNAVKAHFSEYPSYTAIYDAAGLLTNKVYT